MLCCGVSVIETVILTQFLGSSVQNDNKAKQKVALEDSGGVRTGRYASHDKYSKDKDKYTQ